MNTDSFVFVSKPHSGTQIQRESAENEVLFKMAELLGTVEQALESTPLVEQALKSTPLPDAPVQAEGQTETSEPTGAEPVEPTGTSLDKPVQDANLEALRKQLLGDYTRKTQEIAPLRQLLQEQGLTLEDIQQALQLRTAFKENPAGLLQVLQTVVSAAQGMPEPSQPTQVTQPTQPAQQDFDVISFVKETYGEELAKPFERLYQFAQQTQQKVTQLEQQLQKEREEREKDAIQKAVERAESSLSEWLKKNQHFNLTNDQVKQLRYEVSQMVGGSKGLLAGVSDKDFEAAVLRILGPDKYREIIYAQQLKAAREKVEKTAPGPVVTPGTPTSPPIKSDLKFDNSKAVLDEAMNLISHWQRFGIPPT